MVGDAVHLLELLHVHIAESSELAFGLCHFAASKHGFRGSILLYLLFPLDFEL